MWMITGGSGLYKVSPVCVSELWTGSDHNPTCVPSGGSSVLWFSLCCLFLWSPGLKAVSPVFVFSNIDCLKTASDVPVYTKLMCCCFRPVRCRADATLQLSSLQSWEDEAAAGLQCCHCWTTEPLWSQVSPQSTLSWHHVFVQHIESAASSSLFQSDAWWRVPVAHP